MKVKNGYMLIIFSFDKNPKTFVGTITYLYKMTIKHKVIEK
jgi:hypothetical protein